VGRNRICLGRNVEKRGKSGPVVDVTRLVRELSTGLSWAVFSPLGG